MQRFHSVRTVALVAAVSALAGSTWTMAARASRPHLTLTVASTVSCTTSGTGALQLDAYAYRPSVKYAGAFINTGPYNTAADVALVGVETDKSNYSLNQQCAPVKKSIQLTHHRLRSAGVVKSGYDQSLTAFCGVPSRVFVRYRISFASSGKPATATIAVWAKPKKSSRLREIGYVQWSKSRSITYYSPKACVSQLESGA